jgi:hypothetical protein
MPRTRSANRKSTAGKDPLLHPSFYRLEAELAKTEKLEEELDDVKHTWYHRWELEVAQTKKLEEELKDAKNLNEDLVRDMQQIIDAAIKAFKDNHLNEMAIAKMDKDDQDGNNVRPPPRKQNPKRLRALEAQTLAETTSQITKEEPKKQRLEQVS